MSEIKIDPKRWPALWFTLELDERATVEEAERARQDYWNRYREAFGDDFDSPARARAELAEFVAEREREALAQIPADFLAYLFHKYYERLAVTFGYETRPESRCEWEDVPELNRKHMIETAAHVLTHLLVAQQRARQEPLPEPPGEGE